jgi:hypothetical protein
MTLPTIIKAIETVYKGYRFRSRLEARWAVFFDALGITWEYEKEGYDLGELGWYLPDFWLPQWGCFAEVKAKQFTEIELRKCEALPDACLLLDGLPADRFYLLAGLGKEYVFPDQAALGASVGKGRLWMCYGESYDVYSRKADMEAAIVAARSARFEFADAAQ